MLKSKTTGSWFRNRTEVVLIIFLGFYTLFHGGHNERFITGDGKGYYAHLPAMFIYHDWEYSFMENYESTYYEPANYAEFRNQVDGEWVNKYFAGVTLLLMPFFLLAHLVSLVSGLPADGYNPVYQYAVAFAALFWLWTGLYFLRRFFNRQKIPAIVTSIVQVLIVCATPLFFYTVYDASFTHVYSFALIAGFIYFTEKGIKSGFGMSVTIAFLVLGLIIAVRPVNGLVILSVPFIGGTDNFKPVKLIRTIPKKYLFAGFLLLLLPLFYQMALWKAQTGNWLVWSYVGEGFNFSDPHLKQILFSYRKGLFVYTPFLLISLLGLIVLIKQKKLDGFLFFLFLLVVSYVFSSWHSWWYGMTYGQRVFVEYLPYFAWLMAILLVGVRKSLFYLLVGISFLIMLLNFVQINQHRRYILHWSTMNKEKYRKVFLRTGTQWRGHLWRWPDGCSYGSGRILYRKDVLISTLPDPVNTDISEKETKDSFATVWKENPEYLIYKENAANNNEYNGYLSVKLMVYNTKLNYHGKVIVRFYKEKTFLYAADEYIIRNADNKGIWQEATYCFELKDHVKEADSFEIIALNKQKPKVFIVPVEVSIIGN